MTFFQTLAPHWWWLLAAALLGIFEIFAPGIFLVWMAAAAAITGVVVAIAPIQLAWQLGIFALLAIAAVYTGRQAYARNPVGSEDPDLNDRAKRLIGRTVIVETAIEHGEGRVRVGDGVWNARGPDAPSGASVRVIGANGACLVVEAA